ncbi:hypothetical protein SPSIL_050780 [Sporomusa silvacetica DSM 10669]|uniref:Uncharacterized protein n=1 Tax=Sporomusa silvacetica DSM 10669 TaxID=1123289 RepID=A0ABZ3IT53_9FIRM|nr:methyltransferase domain-containing protein [Sporomusa silvacetica]OZC16596.1 hypothetical protein SPSIL_36900 [Sporomusa silvacetica DSM 10669]
MSLEKIYNQSFYNNQMDGSLRSANAMVPLFIEYVKPKTVVDVGCGVGTWLSVFKNQGVDILGFDGEYVDKNLLCIEEDSFIAVDLEKTIEYGKVFDLAISLEVAEHLTESRAPSFVQDLTRLSPVVVFSAAVPRQGGVNHVNEKWQSYWINLFMKCSYLPIDCMRPKIWTCKDIEWWYRQNTLIFCKKEKIADYPKLLQAYRDIQEYQLYDLIHPELFSLRG